jgi:hypothetical protein
LPLAASGERRPADLPAGPALGANPIGYQPSNIRTDVTGVSGGFAGCGGAVLLAALALIASGCVKLDAIYRIIDWKTVILVAGTLPLATALAKTGATAMMANGMVAVLGSLGPLAVLATVFLVTSLVGLFISNSATAVLMAPVAIDAAGALHDSPQAFAMTVAIGCCAAYVTPVSKITPQRGTARTGCLRLLRRCTGSPTPSTRLRPLRFWYFYRRPCPRWFRRLLRLDFDNKRPRRNNDV